MEKIMKPIVIAALLAALSVLPSLAESSGHLVNGMGMTLYFSDRDTGGASHCDTACTAQWPPHYAAENAAGSDDWGVVTRSDGYKQWTYKGKPLYSSRSDSKPGDTNGNGVDGVWHIARP
jgi:predicted lipoprotein with Yx(FWY)xxD motif